MKILFVNHDVSHYGAATSLSLMLRNNPSIEFDMIVPSSAIGKKNQIKKRFNIQSGKLFFFELTLDMSCFVGGRCWTLPLIKRIRTKLYELRDYLKFLLLIRGGCYDLVYLNSIVLYKYLVKHLKCVIHIRESYKPNGNPVLKYVNKAAGIVFIDNATFSPFSENIKTRFSIINNPFDMTGLGSIKQVNTYEGTDLGGKTVFSVIGQVMSEKGVVEIVRAFHEVEKPNVLLFIAGNCHKTYFQKILEVSGGDKRIVVLGHCDSIGKLYRITDYLIRGERYQCIGRTTIEGLFSGCSVLVPGDEPYQEFQGCLIDFDDKIIFYPPGDYTFLKDLIAECADTKMTKRTYHSNVSEHVQKLNDFLEEVVL